MGISISKKDIIWLRKNFEDLSISKKPLSITGNILFNYIYKDIPIQDSYKLSIIQDTKGNIHVFETGGKIEKIAKKISKPMIDLHINKGGSLCLCLDPLKPSFLGNNYSIVKYIKTLTIPFLYATTYLYRYGKRPWGEYEHGALGYLEAYATGKINYHTLKGGFGPDGDPCKIKFPFSKN